MRTVVPSSAGLRVAGRKILVTGGTGMVGRPIVESLAADNEVWCIARFTDGRARESLEALGVRVFEWDLAKGEFQGLPDDFSHVVHTTAYLGSGDSSWQRAIDVNAIGAGLLMQHCRAASAFLFVSFTAVYQPQAVDHVYREDDPVGGNTPWLPVYGVSKVATEAVVRSFSRALGLPVTIGRLGVVHSPAGWGGMAVRYLRMMQAGGEIRIGRPEEETRMQPLHTDDVARQVPLLWQVATVPGTVVNWAGDEAVSEQELLAYIAELTGVRAVLNRTDPPMRVHAVVDNTLRRELIGDCEIGWREGVRKVLAVHAPEVVAA